MGSEKRGGQPREGCDQITYHLKTGSRMYTECDLPERIDGRPVKWDLVEGETDNGGQGARFTGHFED